MKKVYGNEKWQKLGNKPGNDTIKHITNEGAKLLIINFVKQLIYDCLSNSIESPNIKARNEVEFVVKNSPLLEGFDRQAVLEFLDELKEKDKGEKKNDKRKI